MAKRIACIWEAGAGLGHLSRLQPIVQHGLAAGHEVFLVAKELANVHKVFDDKSLHLVQAPYDTTPAPKVMPISWPETLLLRYRSPERLSNYLVAWNTLVKLIKADLIVYDASPTAFIASCHTSARKWAVGSPFFMPRHDSEYVGVFPGTKSDAKTLARLQASERSLVELLNRALNSSNLPATHSSLKGFLRKLDMELVTSLPEFDYFGKRRIGEYVGMPASLDRSSIAPPWPNYGGKKIFAYLKGFSGINLLLESLERYNGSVVVYSREISRDLRGKYKRITFIDEPASMAIVCKEADLMIHMAGSQTVARCIASGLAQLLVPTGLEQVFTAQAAKRLGNVIVVHKSKQNYDEVLSHAIETAPTRVVESRKFETALLDGSYYNSRVGQLLSEL